MKRALIGLALLAATATMSAAQAAPLVLALEGLQDLELVSSNGVPDLSNATDLNFNLGADDFTLASDSRITLIRFWAVQDDAAAYSGSVEFSFRANDGGTPGATLQSGLLAFTQTPTVLDVFGLPVFIYEGVVDIELAAGDYWLALHNGPSAFQPGGIFSWAYSNGSNGNGQAFELPAGPWGTVSAELAFELDVTPRTVPEPGSLALVCAAFAIFFALRVLRRA